MGITKSKAQRTQSSRTASIVNQGKRPQEGPGPNSPKSPLILPAPSTMSAEFQDLMDKYIAPLAADVAATKAMVKGVVPAVTAQLTGLLTQLTQLTMEKEQLQAQHEALLAQYTALEAHVKTLERSERAPNAILYGVEEGTHTDSGADNINAVSPCWIKMLLLD
jgi:hypothetical protein